MVFSRAESTLVDNYFVKYRRQVFHAVPNKYICFSISVISFMPGSTGDYLDNIWIKCHFSEWHLSFINKRLILSIIGLIDQEL